MWGPTCRRRLGPAQCPQGRRERHWFGITQVSPPHRLITPRPSPPSVMGVGRVIRSRMLTSNLKRFEERRYRHNRAKAVRFHDLTPETGNGCDPGCLWGAGGSVHWIGWGEEEKMGRRPGLLKEAAPTLLTLKGDLGTRWDRREEVALGETMAACAGR